MVHGNRGAAEGGLTDRAEVSHQPILIEHANDTIMGVFASEVLAVEHQLRRVAVVEGPRGLMVNQNKPIVASQHEIRNTDDRR